MSVQKISRLIMALLLVSFVGAGKVREKRIVANEIPKDTLITLERTVCFGTCPAYKLTISADGTVVFEGKEYVKKAGTYKGSITKEQLEQLISEFKKIDYFSLRDSYRRADDGCESVVTDNPSAITSIRLNGKSKSINHYHGCRGAKELEELSKLEDLIDKVANTKQWIGGQ